MAPTPDDILDISRKTVSIFSKHGLECCIFGSTASYLHGVKRTPKDVDIVVLSSLYDQETLKQILVRDDSHFYLVASKNRHARYRVLWYNLSESIYHSPYSDCKVDILVPGIMGIPKVPSEYVQMKAGLPIMPLIPQLLLKVQGWSDHRASTRSDMQSKQAVDIGDINELLDIAVEQGADADAPENNWIPKHMTALASTRIWSYTQHGSPMSKGQWKKIGFEIL